MSTGVILLDFDEWNDAISQRSDNNYDMKFFESLEWMIAYAIKSSISLTVLVKSNNLHHSALLNWYILLSTIYQLGLIHSAHISYPLDIFSFSESLYENINTSQIFLLGRCKTLNFLSMNIPQKPKDFHHHFDTLILNFNEMDNCTSSIFAKSPFDVVVLGGTFDHLHSGHKMLLSTAAMISKRRLICGLSYGQSMLSKKKYYQLIQPWNVRAQSVKSFISKFSPLLSLEIVHLYDAYGPTLTDSKIQAIVVSKETRSEADKINTLRISNGLNPLHIIEIGLFNSLKHADRISSTDIRESIYNKDSVI